jgi:hypothetical protein
MALFLEEKSYLRALLKAWLKWLAGCLAAK